MDSSSTTLREPGGPSVRVAVGQTIFENYFVEQFLPRGGTSLAVVARNMHPVDKPRCIVKTFGKPESESDTSRIVYGSSNTEGVYATMARQDVKTLLAWESLGRYAPKLDHAFYQDGMHFVVMHYGDRSELSTASHAYRHVLSLEDVRLLQKSGGTSNNFFAMWLLQEWARSSEKSMDKGLYNFDAKAHNLGVLLPSSSGGQSDSLQESLQTFSRDFQVERTSALGTYARSLWNTRNPSFSAADLYMFDGSHTLHASTFLNAKRRLQAGRTLSDEMRSELELTLAGFATPKFMSLSSLRRYLELQGGAEVIKHLLPDQFATWKNELEDIEAKTIEQIVLDTTLEQLVLDKRENDALGMIDFLEGSIYGVESDTDYLELLSNSHNLRELRDQRQQLAEKGNRDTELDKKINLFTIGYLYFQSRRIKNTKRPGGVISTKEYSSKLATRLLEFSRGNISHAAMARCFAYESDRNNRRYKKTSWSTIGLAVLMGFGLTAYNHLTSLEYKLEVTKQAVQAAIENPAEKDDAFVHLDELTTRIMRERWKGIGLFYNDIYDTIGDLSPLEEHTGILLSAGPKTYERDQLTRDTHAGFIHALCLGTQYEVPEFSTYLNYFLSHIKLGGEPPQIPRILGANLTGSVIEALVRPMSPEVAKHLTSETQTHVRGSLMYLMRMLHSSIDPAAGHLVPIPELNTSFYSLVQSIDVDEQAYVVRASSARIMHFVPEAVRVLRETPRQEINNLGFEDRAGLNRYLDQLLQAYQGHASLLMQNIADTSGVVANGFSISKGDLAIRPSLVSTNRLLQSATEDVIAWGARDHTSIFSLVDQEYQNNSDYFDLLFHRYNTIRRQVGFPPRLLPVYGAEQDSLFRNNLTPDFNAYAATMHAFLPLLPDSLALQHVGELLNYIEFSERGWFKGPSTHFAHSSVDASLETEAYALDALKRLGER